MRRGVWLVAGLSGPLLGGVITDYLHWSVIFWINLPLGLLALAMTSNALRYVPVHKRKHSLDLPGAMLMVTAAVSLVHAVFLMGQQVGLVTNARDAAERIKTEGWDADPRSRDAGCTQEPGRRAPRRRRTSAAAARPSMRSRRPRTRTGATSTAGMR